MPQINSSSWFFYSTLIMLILIYLSNFLVLIFSNLKNFNHNFYKINFYVIFF